MGDVLGGAAGGGVEPAGDATGEVGVSSGLNSLAEGSCHEDGVFGLGNGGVDENGVGAHFQGLGGFGRDAKAGVDDDGDAGLLDDDADFLGGVDALAGADGGAEGHDRCAANLLKLIGEDGVGVDVGEDDESVIDKLLGGLEGLGGIGKEIFRVRYDLQLDPVGAGDGASELGDEEGLFHSLAASGVGQNVVDIPVQVIEDGLFVGVVQVQAADGDGNHLGAGGIHGLDHVVHSAVFAGAEDKPGAEGLASDGELVFHVAPQKPTGEGLKWAETG